MVTPKDTYCYSFRRWGLISAIVAVLGAALLTMGCAGASDSTNAPVAGPTSAPSASAARTGQQLFVSKGCSACHGQNAEGSAIAPALPGHTETQIRKQVRNPIGNMPTYSLDGLNEDELGELVEYITGLRSGAEHVEPTGLGEDAALNMHHWMALSALRAENAEEAQHHMQHIINLAEDAEHRQIVEEALEKLSAGDPHTAEHHMEGVLAGKAEPNLSPSELHLQLALTAVSGHGYRDAEHHLEHFIGGATGEQKEQAQSALEQLSAGNAHDATEMLTRILEEMTHQRHRHN